MNSAEYAYVTLLSSDNYIYFVIALYESWKTTNSKYNFYCLITPEVSKNITDILSNIGCNILFVDNTEIDKFIGSVKCTNDTAFQYALNKLYIYSLDQFKKCIYLDADTILLQNVDNLFELGSFAAVNDLWNYQVTVHLGTDRYIIGKTLFNSGVLVLSPDRAKFKAMLSGLQNLPKIPEKIKSLGKLFEGWHDQNILAYYNQNWPEDKSSRLSIIYNFLVNPAYYAVFNTKINDIKIKHYAGPKQWILAGLNPPSKSTTTKYWYEYINEINICIAKYNLELPLLKNYHDVINVTN